MADSPDLWTAMGRALDEGVNPPVRADGSPILDTAWPRWYRGQTYPTEGVLPVPGYVLLGLRVEDPAGSYNGQVAQDGLWRAHCWAKTPDDAWRLAKWVRSLWHDVPLAVVGYEPVVGQVSLTGPMRDTQGTAWQVELTYTAEAYEAAA